MENKGVRFVCEHRKLFIYLSILPYHCQPFLVRCSGVEVLDVGVRKVVLQESPRPFKHPPMLGQPLPVLYLLPAFSTTFPSPHKTLSSFEVFTASWDKQFGAAKDKGQGSRGKVQGQGPLRNMVGPRRLGGARGNGMRL